MKRFAFASLLLAMLGAASIGHAEGTTITGSVPFGNPAQTAGEGGYSENNSACDPAGEENGVDGLWYALPASAVGQDATLDIADDLEDADAYFYNAACEKLAYTAMAANFVKGPRAPFNENDEAGTVPEGAAFLLVNGFLGTDIAFTFTTVDAA